jgi:acetyl-CoA C-acetyltransferase
MSSSDVYIVAAKRTPLGALLGSLSSLSSSQLAAAAHVACMEQARVSPKDIDEVIGGCVLQAGQGQGPARSVINPSSDVKMRDVVLTDKRLIWLGCHTV